MTSDLTIDISAIQSINAVPKILKTVCKITGMGFAAVARVTEDRWVCCAARDEINFGLGPGGELKLETTICNEIRSSETEVVIDDVDADARYCNHPTPALYGFKSYISMPIKLSDGTFFGTLCAIDPQSRRLKTEEIIEMFRLFAELISTHIEQAYRVMKSETTLRQSEENLRVTEASLLDERRTAGLREQFIAVLGHDLRNPLAALDAGTRMLTRAGLNEKATEYVALMQKSIVRMSGLIDNVLDFARGRLGDGLTVNRDARQPLTPVLEHVIHELHSAWPERIINTHLSLDEPINCDRTKIGQMLSNLVANAITHGSDAPIEVNAKTSAGVLDISVRNAGDPIPEALMPRLFEPFERGTRTNQQGLGLGLFIASEIARAHGGTLTARSEPQMTCFTFQMPLSAG